MAEKDLHCLARVLQGCRYMDNDMFGCCKYCLYQRNCNESAREGKVYFTEVVTKKLQNITGVYLGINPHNIKEKLLVNSVQSTNKCGNMQ